jgi:potassium/hydrogen antiporter
MAASIMGDASLESIIIVAALLVIVSILVSKISSKLGVPVLLLFLLIGMLAGSEGIGGIEFDDPRLAQSVGVVALIFILFSGGLDTSWRSVRPVLLQGFLASTIGVLVTALTVGLFTMFVLKVTLLQSMLLGAIISSTDAAAVFAVMRSKKASLKGQLKPFLELESGSNDPMAVFLTMGFITLLTVPDESPLALVPMFLQQMIIGSALGYGIGRLMLVAVNRLRLEYEGLYSVLSISAVLLTYGATSSLGGNGFLAVYTAGLVMGNGDFIHKRSLIHFHDGLAWLMQIAMFLTLGLLVFPSRLLPVAEHGLLIAAFLMFVARPLGIFPSLLFSRRFSMRDRIMASWVGLRGAVPIILATFPYLAGLHNADMMFNVVFFIVLTSVLLQGTSIPLVAQWLGLSAPLAAKSVDAFRYPAVVCEVQENLTELTIGKDSPAAGKQIIELGLPDEALIVLLTRDETATVPGGGTVLEAGDRLLVLAEPEVLEKVRRILGTR